MRPVCVILVAVVLSACSVDEELIQSPATSLHSSAKSDGSFVPKLIPTQAPAPVRSNPQVLTMEEAVHAAVAWHPSIDEAVGRVQQSSAEINVARAGYLPKIRGGIDSSYDTSDGGGWRPRLDVSASQMIYDFGKVSSSVDASNARANASRNELLLGVDTLVRDTANAVVEVQRYQALNQVANAKLKGVQAIADLVRQRSASGASTRSDQVQADARVNAAQSTVQEIGGQLDRWQSTLSTLVGSTGAVAVGQDTPSWLLSTCTATEPDWSLSPAVLQAEAGKAEALAQRNYSRAQAFPTIALEASAGYGLNRDARAGSSSDEPDVKVGLNVSGSLYDGGATAANRRASEFALKSADAAILNTKLNQSRNLLQARSQINSLQSMLTTLSARQGMLSQTRDLYRQQYLELGTRTLLDLLNSEEELHQAAFDEVNSKHDLRRLGVECLFNSGRSRSMFDLNGMTVRGVTI